MIRDHAVNLAIRILGMLLGVHLHAVGDGLRNLRHRHDSMCAVGFQTAAVTRAVIGEFDPRLFGSRFFGVVEHVRDELREILFGRHVVRRSDRCLSDFAVCNGKGIRAQYPGPSRCSVLHGIFDARIFRARL